MTEQLPPSPVPEALNPEALSRMMKSPCEEPCDKPRGVESDTLAVRMLKNSFLNALDLCFDEVKQEPKKLLVIGGCRQRKFAQHLALLLPTTEITLFDIDADVAVKTKEEICCRFEFGTGALEAMPFPDETFDLVFAHNLFEFTQDWGKAVDETARITARTGNFMISYHQPTLWKLFGHLPGMKGALNEAGVSLPATLPDENELLLRLQLHATIGCRLTPFPWKIIMSNLKPVREEKLTLAS